MHTYNEELRPMKISKTDVILMRRGESRHIKNSRLFLEL